MMRRAIISDIHANGEALKAVMSSIETHSIDHIICLGDLVNYGVDFEFCIETVEANTEVCLMGNHDSTVLGRDPLRIMNPEAQRSVLWTREHLLKEKHRRYLRNLQMTFSTDEFFFVHASPGAPERWDYVRSWFSAAPQFNYFKERICFIGHSHIPRVYYERQRKSVYQERSFDLPFEQKVIINVGSVGQPRDRDPRACYVILDEDRETAEFVRVSYDAQRASEKIAMTGVSEFNAQRLLVGM